MHRVSITEGLVKALSSSTGLVRFLNVVEIVDTLWCYSIFHPERDKSRWQFAERTAKQRVNKIGKWCQSRQDLDFEVDLMTSSGLTKVDLNQPASDVGSESANWQLAMY